MQSYAFANGARNCIKAMLRAWSFRVMGFATMPFVTIVGMIAGVLTTVAFLPQVLRTWKTRSTADISLVMFLIYVTGIVLWLIYGLMLHDMPLITSNAVTLVFSGTILGLKLRHG